MEESSELGRQILNGLNESQRPVDEVAAVVDEHAVAPPLAPKAPFTGWIDWISIEGIRTFGPEQKLELSRGLTIVYAENGVGKTSIVDAVELLSTGGTSRARQFSGIESEVKDEDHVPHARADGQRSDWHPHVTARWRASPDAELQTASWASQWSQSAENPPPVRVFARRRLREVISLKGVERAERLGHALGLGDLIESWTAARRALETHAKATDPEPQHDIREDVQRWLDTVAKDDDVDVVKAKIEQEADDTISTIEPVGGGARSPSELAYSNDLLAQPVQRPPAVPAPDALNRLADEWTEHERHVPPTPGVMTDEVLAVLRAFRSIAVEGQTCVACEVGMVTRERLDAIGRTLADASAYGDHQALEQQLVGRAHTAVGTALGYDLNWKIGNTSVLPGRDTHDDESMGELADAYQSLEALVSEWNEQANELRSLLESARSDPSPTTVWNAVVSIRRISEIRQRAETASEKAEQRRQDTRTTLASRRASERTAAESQRDNAQLIADAVVQLRDDRAVRVAAGKAAKRLKSKLNDTVEQKCSDLAQPINEWLVRLAPDRTPSVLVKTTASAGKPRLNILVKGGHVPAVGRLSDSQLDMLGLAAHLATAEREVPGEPIFIDDPADMLDHATRERLVSDGIGRLLHGDEGIQGRQVVVLTHDNEILRTLWRHHGDQKPLPVQRVIELDGNYDPPQASIHPRSALEHLARVKQLVHSYQNEQNRIWLRSALGNNARQALEMIVQGILQVVGPLGHGYHQSIFDHEDGDGGPSGVGKLIDDSLLPLLDKLERAYRECGASRHLSALQKICQLRDCVARRKDYLLDEASHSDPVYPSVGEIKDYTGNLKPLAELLEPYDSAHEDEFPMSSRWYEELKLCESCNFANG